MGVGALAVALDCSGLDVLFGVIKGTAGVAHEYRPGYGHYGSAYQYAAYELNTEEESSNCGDEHGQH